MFLKEIQCGYYWFLKICTTGFCSWMAQKLYAANSDEVGRLLISLMAKGLDHFGFLL